MTNYMKLEVAAHSVNEAFARSAVAAFALPLSPSLSELSDIKTAVSEAVTNSIVHAYRKQKGDGVIQIECTTQLNEKGGGILHITITDFGCGITDVEKAILPFYTTLADDERSGMGFTIMQTFMSDFSLESTQGKGTVVRMSKKIIGDSILDETKQEKAEIEEIERIHA